MKTRLDKFMKSEGLTPGRLAEMVGVQPSGISHLLAGRNKPGFDFIYKILQRFPNLSPDWLILGNGEMYRDMGRTQVAALNGLHSNAFETLEQLDKLGQMSQMSQTNAPITNATQQLSSPTTVSPAGQAQVSAHRMHVNSQAAASPSIDHRPRSAPQQQNTATMFDIADTFTSNANANFSENRSGEQFKSQEQFNPNLNSATKDNYQEFDNSLEQKTTIEKIVIFFTNNTFKEYTSK